MAYAGPGRYLHYKGGEYEVYGLAVLEADKDSEPDWDPHHVDNQYVIYEPKSSGSLLDRCIVKFWVRKLTIFNENVGGLPRFQRIQ